MPSVVAALHLGCWNTAIMAQIRECIVNSLMNSTVSHSHTRSAICAQFRTCDFDINAELEEAWTAAIMNGFQINVDEYNFEPYQYLEGIPIARLAKSSQKTRNIYLSLPAAYEQQVRLLHMPIHLMPDTNISFVRQSAVISYLHDTLLGVLRFDVLTASGALLAQDLQGQKWKAGVKIGVGPHHLGPEEKELRYASCMRGWMMCAPG